MNNYQQPAKTTRCGRGRSGERSHSHLPRGRLGNPTNHDSRYLGNSPSQMNQHTLKNGSTSCTTRIAFPFTRLRAIPNQELMVIWWLESAAGSRQLPALRIGIRSLARQPQTCALPQVAGAPKLKRESVLFSTYGATRRAAGARARRHLAGPTWGIEESFLFQVLGSPRYMYGWSPSLLRSAG